MEGGYSEHWHEIQPQFTPRAPHVADRKPFRGSNSHMDLRIDSLPLLASLARRVVWWNVWHVCIAALQDKQWCRERPVLCFWWPWCCPRNGKDQRHAARQPPYPTLKRCLIFAWQRSSLCIASPATQAIVLPKEAGCKRGCRGTRIARLQEKKRHGSSSSHLACRTPEVSRNTVLPARVSAQCRLRLFRRACMLAPFARLRQLCSSAIALVTAKVRPTARER